MEIKLIGQALDEIKEEDQNNLSVLEDKERRLEDDCQTKEREAMVLRDDYESREELDYIVKSPIRRLHMLLPLIAIPSGFILTYFAIMGVVIGSPIAWVFVIALLLEMDAANTLIELFPRIITGEKIDFKGYIGALKNLFASRRETRAALVDTYNRLHDAEELSFTSSSELDRIRYEIAHLKRELAQIDGYQSSIDYIVEKQYFKELKDTSDIVQFVNSKKELKKVIG